ncbi:MAG: hypothetical protein HQ564_03340 [Candidatus Saganbacteria bacterium]|nr:hypothetical protein [Candidatus Saganbacteria bacterium]
MQFTTIRNSFRYFKIALTHGKKTYAQARIQSVDPHKNKQSFIYNDEIMITISRKFGRVLHEPGTIRDRVTTFGRSFYLEATHLKGMEIRQVMIAPNDCEGSCSIQDGSGPIHVRPPLGKTSNVFTFTIKFWNNNELEERHWVFRHLTVDSI